MLLSVILIVTPSIVVDYSHMGIHFNGSFGVNFDVFDAYIERIMVELMLILRLS